MTTQDMKVRALQKALAAADQRGEVEVENFNKTWKLKCGCHDLTSFGFYLFYVRADGGWHPHSEVGEEEAKAFLAGMGEKF